MKQTNKLFALIILLFILFMLFMLFMLSSCGEGSNEKLKEKVESELEYVNIKIINMLNSLNNISFENYKIVSDKVKQEQKQENVNNSNSQNGNDGKENNETSSSGQNQKQETSSQNEINTTNMTKSFILGNNKEDIDWNSIKYEIESLNESWSIIILDLYSLNVKNDTILDFSSKINKAMVNIKNEDKQASLLSLADLYKSIPLFLEEINAKINLIKIRQTQSYVINAYVLADNINNSDIYTNLQNAVDIYSEVISDINFTKDKTFKINKTYVLLNELANAIETKDADIFYVKYKNFMEAINEI